MPDKTPATRDNPYLKKGHKIVEDWLIILFCANWTGHDKLKSLVISKVRSIICKKYNRTFNCFQQDSEMVDANKEENETQ